MAASGSHFLRLQNVSKHYAGVTALAGVDFQLKGGEIHCLAGENGSGKSTLIKIISGVTPPEAGAVVEIAGHRHHRLTRRQAIDAGIEVIYQDLALFPNLSVAENIAWCGLLEARRRWMNWRHAGQRAAAALAQLQVQLPLGKAVGELSAAEQQLVAIARACTARLRLLIMDEPTTALTRHEINALFAVVHQLQQRGVTILFVSHKLDEVFEIADRVTVLRDGRHVGCFPTDQLTPASLVQHMTGRPVQRHPPASPPGSTPRVLQVSGLSR
ncbi:MAG: ATP-binding cassette domain-containing protein, partial [Planctomycetales bacterium]|nr:ATP-binding cassette domain-containing protein [Planctomycetales bacterium]